MANFDVLVLPQAYDFINGLPHKMRRNEFLKEDGV